MPRHIKRPCGCRVDESASPAGRCRSHRASRHIKHHGHDRTRTDVSNPLPHPLSVRRTQRIASSNPDSPSFRRGLGGGQTLPLDAHKREHPYPSPLMSKGNKRGLDRFNTASRFPLDLRGKCPIPTAFPLVGKCPTGQRGRDPHRGNPRGCPPPSLQRKGDAASEARRRGMPRQLLNAETLNNPTPNP